eukprot:342785-Pelagomonas_calceolata.AAC.4
MNCPKFMEGIQIASSSDVPLVSERLPALTTEVIGIRDKAWGQHLCQPVHLDTTQAPLLPGVQQARLVTHTKLAEA